MFLRPIQTIFLLTFKFTFKYLVKLKLFHKIIPLVNFNSFYFLFRSLFTTSNLLINTIGFFPTIQVLRTINQLIRRVAYHGVSAATINSNLLSLQTLYPNLNSYPVEIITEAIRSYLKDCLKYPKLFSKLYSIFLFLNYFSFIRYLFKPTYFVLRLTFGSIVTTLGILWSESLQSISFLKYFAYLIRDNLEYYFDIIIPTGQNNPLLLRQEEEYKNNDRNEIIFYL